jgi:hypothetical protein
MPSSEKERSNKYRKHKTKTHTRVSPWFFNDVIKKIDKARGEQSRAAWLIQAAHEKLKIKHP